MAFSSHRREMARLQTTTYNFYHDYLCLLLIHRFKWDNLPKTMNRRFLETQLLNRGSISVFEHEVGGMLCLPYSQMGLLNVYGEPLNWRIHSANGRFFTQRNASNSVIMWDNFLRNVNTPYIHNFAQRLADIDTSVQVNMKAQKTPILILCDESQRLSVVNMYEQYEGNRPVIQGTKGLDLIDFKVLKTDAPYVADKLLLDKQKIWQEIITFFGFNNANSDKKERLVSDEVNANNGIVSAGLAFGLDARKDATERINDMFSLDIMPRPNDELIINENGGTDTWQDLQPNSAQS